jgi:predicted transcriptional regulator of viral defense system
MNKLKQEINKIKKDYFTFADLRKISDLDDASLRVAASRMLKSGEIKSLAKGLYCRPDAILDLPKIAVEIYGPSYLSFEWVLSRAGILSQQAYGITLATAKRARQISLGEAVIVYRHIRSDLFFGYRLEDGYLIAEPEKAFLDLAYLSLNGYAKFDPEEMSLAGLDKARIKKYLKKFKSKRLEKLVGKVLVL